MFKSKFIGTIAITTMAALLVLVQSRSLADSAQSTTAGDGAKRKASGQTAGVGDTTGSSQTDSAIASERDSTLGNAAKRKASGRTASSGISASDAEGSSATRTSTTDTTVADGAKRKATGQTAGVADTATSSPTKRTRVDLNTADQAQLEALPGIGPVTARAIIAARPFKSVADLKQVNGIGDVRYAELRNRVTVSHDRYSGTGSSATSSTDSSSSRSKSTRDTEEIRTK
jgi:competence protein ComEA